MDQPIPSFDAAFPALHGFLLALAEEFRAGTLTSWEDLEDRVGAFFTPDRMEQMEAALPGWRKMASYLDGVTRTHVACVFLSLYMLPEFSRLSQPQQNLLKWAVLLHDLEKEIAKGKRDPLHAFHSAVTAARRLPDLGFPVEQEYSRSIDSWSKTTMDATLQLEQAAEPVQDNSRLPAILSGIDAMFGEGSAAAQIVKIVLLHMSVNVVSEWPQAAPLTEAEISRFISRELLPLLRVMMLADNEGWGLFSPEVRQKERNETLQTFEALERNIT